MGSAYTASSCNDSVGSGVQHLVHLSTLNDLDRKRPHEAADDIVRGDFARVATFSKATLTATLANGGVGNMVLATPNSRRTYCRKTRTSLSYNRVGHEPPRPTVPKPTSQ
ncbi:unnamed protein product [Prorocentrum cordatum]|uniref:Subtilisin n=1 Tax=Prorocentrum cordatum TaxID=2364126 RepID=A0ABN9Y3P7_9DINO|nr:unnamed protein product [Polarella glacialis]